MRKGKTLGLPPSVGNAVACGLPFNEECGFYFGSENTNDMTRLFAGTPLDIPPRCDRCGQLEEDCQCKPLPPLRVAPDKQTVKVRVDRRKHKRLVTVVWGLSAESNDLPDLLSKLKSACGSGGCSRTTSP